MKFDDILNVVGLGLIGLAFVYIHIIRPKKLQKKPTDLEVKKPAFSQMKMSNIAARHYSDKYFVLSRQSFSELFHSPTLSKIKSFKDMMTGMTCDVVLIDKETKLPVMAVLLSSKDSETKANYITSAGIPCILFDHVDDEKQFVEDVNKALGIFQKDDASEIAIAAM